MKKGIISYRHNTIFYFLSYSPLSVLHPLFFYFFFYLQILFCFHLSFYSLPSQSPILRPCIFHHLSLYFLTLTSVNFPPLLLSLFFSLCSITLYTFLCGGECQSCCQGIAVATHRTPTATTTCPATIHPILHHSYSCRRGWWWRGWWWCWILWCWCGNSSGGGFYSTLLKIVVLSLLKINESFFFSSSNSPNKKIVPQSLI